MAYLDNSSEITIDATLTRRGREVLASGQNLAITKFAVADDEIDYSLYDPAHPKGSAYYDSAITALPILEASVDETKMLRYKLMTMGRGQELIPSIRVNSAATILTDFIKSTNETLQTSRMSDVEITINPYPENVTPTNTSYTLILGDYEAGSILFAASVGRPEGSEVRTMTYKITGNTFRFQPNNATPGSGGELTRSISTTLTITGDQTGASLTLPVRIQYV